MVTGHEREVVLGVSDEARPSAEFHRARDLAEQTLAEVTPGEATYADAASALGVVAWQRFRARRRSVRYPARGRSLASGGGAHSGRLPTLAERSTRRGGS